MACAVAFYVEIRLRLARIAAIIRVAGPRLKNPTSTLVREPTAIRAKKPPKKLRSNTLALREIDSKTRVFFHPKIPQRRRSKPQTGLAQITRHPSHASAGEARSKIENMIAGIVFIGTLLSKSLSRRVGES